MSEPEEPMSLIRKTDAKTYEVPGALCRLYGDCPTGRLTCATVEQKGRSPPEGWYLNERCTEAFFVLSGTVTFTTPDGEEILGPGDLRYMPPGVRFALQGEAEILIFIEPSWDKSQNRIVPS
jgi:mannose-6-phosphate isomerase-like protein (cupin superfamily)